MSDYLQRLIDYNSWANEQLLAFLRTVPADTLDARAAGVYGSIRETLEHLLTSEARYVTYLVAPGPIGPLQLTGNSTLDELDQLAREAREGCAGLVTRLPEAGTLVALRDGNRAVATILTQLVSHGCEHRAHVATILGSRGIEPPEFDAWAHGILIGGDDWPAEWGPEPPNRRGAAR